MKACTALFVLWAGVAVAQGVPDPDEPRLDRESLDAPVPLEEGSHAVKIPAQRLDTHPNAVKSSRPASAPAAKAPAATAPARAPAAAPQAPVQRSDSDVPAWASGPALTPEEIRAAVKAQEEAEARERAAPAAPKKQPAPGR